MATAQDNESERSLAWLRARMNEAQGQGLDITRAWVDMRQRMLASPPIGYLQDWVSDPWIARVSRFSPVGAITGWAPPVRFDAWPTFDRAAELAREGWRLRRTACHDNQAAAPDHNDYGETLAAVNRFLAMNGEVRRHGDVTMIQLNQVRAWVNTAFGSLLGGIVFTPPPPTPPLLQAALQRLAIPRQVELPDTWFNLCEEHRLVLLYNMTVEEDGFASPATRVGQSAEWGQHWHWLSADLSRDDMLAAVRLAARIMKPVTILLALYQGLLGGDVYLKTVALAVLRRWLLVLKAMAWLETALDALWIDIRPQDLACFAYDAVKPDWHRSIALSHRSSEVKPKLAVTGIWSSGQFAVDATYMPSWETNTAMVWSLFASTPVIARVRSPTYTASLWCRREAELTSYLVERDDFFPERFVFDLELDEIDRLDRFAAAGDARTTDAAEADEPPGADDPAQRAPIRLRSDFPPICLVWTAKPMPAWEVYMLAAAAAVRLINYLVPTTELANQIADALEDGLALPAPAPTNNPDGWRGYAEILRDLRQASELGGDVRLRLPLDYGADEKRRDIKLADLVPDLSGGTPALRDVLVAFEWLRTEWPAMINEKRGDFLCIDLREVSRAAWESDVGLALMRGLAAMRTPVPLWFLQRAGQDVENWPALGDRPIFTQHVPKQFAWMLLISFERGEAQSLFPADSGLHLSDELKAWCTRQKAQ